MELKRIGKLVIAIIFCQIAGAIGAIFTMPAINNWYAGITKASFNPPNWIFLPAWTILFTLMGISLFLIAEKGIKEKKVNAAIAFFAIQLILNIVWSLLFFGLKKPMFAFFEIILLWLAILGTIIKFYPISKKAAWLLVPYLLWVSFAAILNFFVWQLNK